MAEQFGPLSADVQIEVIAGLKDRQKLVQLIGKLNPRSVEYNKAQLILANAVSLCESPRQVPSSFRPPNGTTESAYGPYTGFPSLLA